ANEGIPRWLSGKEFRGSKVEPIGPGPRLREGSPWVAFGGAGKCVQKVHGFAGPPPWQWSAAALGSTPFLPWDSIGSSSPPWEKTRGYPLTPPLPPGLYRSRARRLYLQLARNRHRVSPRNPRRQPRSGQRDRRPRRRFAQNRRRAVHPHP